MTIPPKHPLVMGIINVTPDSFSGDGLLTSDDFTAQSAAQGVQMASDGARILDIGGESSRPGSTPITEAEEIRRIIPTIQHLKRNLPTTVLAVDTTKAEVALRAFHAGASIINDVSALTHDPTMARLAAEHDVKIVLMHNRSRSNAVTASEMLGHTYLAPVYEDVVREVSAALEERIEVALTAGVRRENIIIDPGIGFGKTVAQNLALIAHLKTLKKLGFPILMGVSRKSFIGLSLDLPVEERLEGTSACVTASVLSGADILRVHDVKFMARVVTMATALRDA